MELALLLVTLIIVELGLTCYMLARVRSYHQRIKYLDHRLDMIDVKDNDQKQTFNEDATLSQLQALAGTVSNEDIAQASAIIKALGLDKVDGNAN